MKAPHTLIAAAILVAACPPAFAAVVGYTSPASYNAAVAADLFFIDFNDNVGITDGTGFHPGVDFDSPESASPDEVTNSGGILRDRGSVIAPNGVGPLGGTLTTPVDGIAFQLSSIEGTAQTVRVFDTAGGLIGEAVTPSFDTFFGVVSTIPIKSFVIQNGVFITTGGNDRYFLDDFRASVVPEPAAAGLLCITTAIAFAKRRRRTRASTRT